MSIFKIIIPIHSFIDVITNSSTSVYVGCHDNTIKFAIELIDDILRISGIDKKAEDIFEFKITVDKSSESDKIYEDLNEYYSDDELDGIDYDAKSKLADDIFYKMCSGEIEQHDGWGESYGGFDNRNLIITSKTNNNDIIDLTSKIESIFQIDGSYDG